MGWQRARKPEQKEKRRADLLNAAAELFQERGFEGVPLVRIAEQAGVSKAAVYSYFDSKEEIFLELMIEDFRAWATRIERALAPLAGSNDAQSVAAAIVSSAVESPRMIALASILSSVLEQKVGEEQLVEFKTEIVDLIRRNSNALHAAVPALSVEQLGTYLHWVMAMSNGLWPETNPSPVLKAVLSRPEFVHMRSDHAAELERAAAVMLTGLLEG